MRRLIPYTGFMTMHRFTSSVLCLLSLVALGGCGIFSGGKAEVPKAQTLELKESRGSLTGDDGFFSFGGDGKKNSDQTGLGVNSFLWRATLDTLAFMPLSSVDPFGGVIITDWYEDPKTPGERFKVNALILDKTLRSDGVKVTLFKQRMDKKSGAWRDIAVSNSMARELEDTILTRARQLRLAQN